MRTTHHSPAHSARPLAQTAIERIEAVRRQHQARRAWSRDAVAVDCPTPGWLMPHPQRDLAARIAGALVLRWSVRLGYLALGECATHAMIRICLQTGDISRTALEERDLTEAECRRLVRVSGRLACSNLVFLEREFHPQQIRVQASDFIQQARLQVLVVDEPDVPTLRNPQLLPAADQWRIRMEFREAVRGTNVALFLPG